MAEPTDRPGQAPPSPVPPYPSEPVLRAPEARADTEGPDYKPLALAAIVGFSLAVLYAAFLVLCWLAAWFTGKPLLMSPLTLVLPLVAVAVCALAWLQVQRSEGTRAGGRLALWGMALGGFFGLSYAAYLVASYAAVEQQADAFATRWLDMIRSHQLDEAFVLTRDPAQRPRVGPDLRRELEIRFNATPDGAPHGDYATFLESDLVRLVNHGVTAEDGASTQIKSLGARGWEYKDNGYKVQLLYEVTNPEGVTEVQVTAHGREEKEGGRQWGVLLQETAPLRRLQETPRHQRLMELRELSGAFAEDWLKKIQYGKADEAFLDTQPPDQRPRLRAEYRAAELGAALAPGAVAARVAPLADREAAARLYLPGYRDFLRGDLLQAPADTFWAEGRLRTEIPDEARKLFDRPGEWLSPFVRLEQPRSPLWSQQGDRLRFYHVFIGSVFRRYAVRGVFLVDTDAGALDNVNESPAWRLAGIELQAGKTLDERNRMMNPYQH
jgi:hypothetical protein